jgi:siroheme synthase (precorrin-2 oxidase/ferrochelatase)
VLLVGGGAVATGRLYYLLEAGAKVTLIAPADGLTPEVKHRIDEGLVDRWFDREWEDADGETLRRTYLRLGCGRGLSPPD